MKQRRFASCILENSSRDFRTEVRALKCNQMSVSPAIDGVTVLRLLKCLLIIMLICIHVLQMMIIIDIVLKDEANTQLSLSDLSYLYIC